MDPIMATVGIIVDDDATRCFLRDNLESDGYQVIHCDTGINSIDSVHKPMVWIIDTSYTAIAAMLLRATRTSWSSPLRDNVIVLAGRTDHIPQSLKESGRFLLKPFSYPELRAKTAALVRIVQVEESNKQKESAQSMCEDCQTVFSRHSKSCDSYAGGLSTSQAFWRQGIKSPCCCFSEDWQQGFQTGNKINELDGYGRFLAKEICGLLIDEIPVSRLKEAVICRSEAYDAVRYLPHDSFTKFIQDKVNDWTVSLEQTDSAEIERQEQIDLIYNIILEDLKNNDFETPKC